ncbi:MAG: sugar ABC transporter permease [Vicinamibacteraceae bacterium]
MAIATDAPAHDQVSGPAEARAFSVAAEANTKRLLVLLALTAVVWLVFNQLTDGIFLTSRNLSNVSVQLSMTALAAIGITLLLFVRQIDLSVGSLYAVVAVMTVLVQVRHQWDTPAAVALGLAIGLALGAFNGAVVTRVGVPAFVVTLAAWTYLQGFAFAISDAQVLAGTRESFRAIASSTIPVPLTIAVGAAGLGIWAWTRRGRLTLAVRRPRPDRAGQGPRPVDMLAGAATIAALGVTLAVFATHRGVPYPVVIVAVVAAVGLFVTRKTTLGRHIYAIGGNREAARRAGLKVDRIILGLFCVMGLLTALAGIIQASRLDAGPPSVGPFLALDAISAAVVGGTSLFGGVGSIVGTLLGTLLLASIANGLSLMGINTFYQYMASGVILLAVVSIDAIGHQRVRRA